MNISEKINAFIDECGGERDAVNVALTKIETLEAQLEATRELFIDSETASIAWSETSAKTSTRLIATKFVADEAVGLVGELVAALTQLHTVSSTIFPPENEKVPLLWRMAIQQAAAALAKAAQFTAAITSTAPTVGGATETQIFPPVDAVAEFDEHGLGEADYYTGTTREG